MKTSLNKNQRGVGLIEVLVALVVLSTALLALALLQARSLQFNHASYLESQSNVYAYDLLERIRVGTLSDPKLLDSYKVDLTSTAVTSISNTTVQADVESWRANSIKNLPGGSAKIACSSTTKKCDIKIIWTDLSASDKNNPDAKITFPYSATL